MNRIRVIGIGAATFMMFCLTGCWDSHDIDKNRYASALGFDYADRQYTLYSQMIDLANVAKQEKGKSDSPPIAYIGKGQAATLNMAVNNLYQTTQQRALWSHITSIVVTEDALNKGIAGFEDAYDRFHDTRYTQWVYGTRENIENLFRISDFFNMSALSTILHEPINNYKQRSWIEPISWLHFLADIQEPGKTVVMPTLTVNPNQWKKNQDSEPKLQVGGAFIISGKTLKGWLGNEQLIGLRWMNPSTERTPLPIMDGNQALGVLSLEHPKLKVKATFVNGMPRYKINLVLKGNIVEMNDDATVKKLTQMAKSLIQKEVRETFLHALALNADIYQFDYYTYVHHYGMWKQLEKEHPPHVNEQSLESIDVDIKLLHSGILRTFVEK